MYSNRKPYYQLKKSMSDFFSGYSRFIKQSLTKESVAEKPYLESEYPQMHLNLPEFSYRGKKRDSLVIPKPSAFPESAGLIRTYTIIYLKPSCLLDIWNLPEEVSPGDTIHFEGNARIPASTPRSPGTMFVWTLSCSSKEVLLRMLDADTGNHGQNPIFEAEVLESITDTSIVVCAKAFVSGITIEKTYSTIGGLPITSAYKHGIFSFMEISAGDQAVWASRRTYSRFAFDCGCFDLLVLVAACSCDIISIGYTTQGMQVDEVQELTVTGGVEGCTYAWEITAGSGSLSAATGLSVNYTAPDENPECAGNATISLSIDGTPCDTLEIAINAVAGTNLAYEKFDEVCWNCVPNGYSAYGITCTNTYCWKCLNIRYNCDGSFNYASSSPTCSSTVCTGCLNSEDLNYWCNTYCNSPSTTDYRSAASKTAGCCPEELI